MEDQANRAAGHACVGEISVEKIRIYAARKIVTLNPHRPIATHVAVREGRILAVGTLGECTSWGPHTIDRRFADKIILPGFVEGHGHVMTGGLWRYAYVGHIDRTSPDGRKWPALRDNSAVVQRLSEVAATLPEGAAILGWGLDPLFLQGTRLSRHELDRVSTTQPVVILHSNGHLVTANSFALSLAGFDQHTEVTGVMMGEDGFPSGELQEFAAMMPVLRRVGFDLSAMSQGEDTLRGFAETARRAGVTTIVDLGRNLTEADVDWLTAFSTSDACPIRLSSVIMAHFKRIDDIIADAEIFKKRSTDRLKFGSVKIVLDGSIQGFTAKLKWPGYFRGMDHGIWNVAPNQLIEMISALNHAHIQIHVHTNGDEATDLALEAFEIALRLHPHHDHRHTLQHCQLASPSQYERIKALGLCVNLFANHLHYFGDKHYETTIGPDRTERMNACGTAVRLGIPLAIHSDTPVTPLGPLLTAWCAVNRRTESGRLLGANERISVEQALHAITLGPAYTLKMDHEIGSIEVGKFADFAILADDPLSVAPEALKDIEVLGTVLGGQPTQALFAEVRD